MAKRVAIATCREHPGLIAGDDEALAPRLEAAGFATERVRWDDAEADWSSFDAVLIRTTWDYQERLSEFLAWVDHVAEVSRVFNGPATVRGNVDKRYMKVLEAGGVPIVPTAWVECGGELDEDGVRALMAERGWPWCATKPVVGAGASGLLIFGEDEAAKAARHITEQAAAHGGVLVQPLVEGIKQRGEMSVVLFDGEFSHAVRKVPGEGEWRVQIEFGGKYSVEYPSADELDVAERATAVLGEASGEGTPLYARIDLVEVDGIGACVIEAELVEPELFFPWCERAGDVMAARLAARLG